MITTEQQAKINELVTTYMPSIDADILNTQLCVASIELLGGFDNFIETMQLCVKESVTFGYKKVGVEKISAAGNAAILKFYEDNQQLLVEYANRYSDYIRDESGLQYLLHFAFAFPEFEDSPRGADGRKLKINGDSLQRIFTENNAVTDADKAHKLHIARFMAFDYIVNFCLSWYEFEELETAAYI